MAGGLIRFVLRFCTVLAAALKLMRNAFAGAGMGTHARSSGRHGRRSVGGRMTRQAEALALPQRTVCSSMCMPPSQLRPRAKASFAAVARPVRPHLRVARPRVRCAPGMRSWSCARRIAARLRSTLSARALPHLHLQLWSIYTLAGLHGVAATTKRAMVSACTPHQVGTRPSSSP